MSIRYCPFKKTYALYLECQECDSKTCKAFFCIVVGSRTFNDYLKLSSTLDNLLRNQENVVIISGGAKGADALAEKYARDRGYPLIVFPAEWDKLGKSAGYIRNKQMHDFAAHFEDRGCVAFWDGKSKGTKQNFQLASDHNTPIKIIAVNRAM